MPLFFFADQQGDPHRDLIELIIIIFFFALTPLCPHFTFTYPAAPLFSLTLLCVYFIFTYPAVPLFFFTAPIKVTMGSSYSS